MKRMILHFLAILGACSILFTAYIYHQGLEFRQQLDPKAVDVFEEFTRRSMNHGVASANIIKLPLAPDVSRDDAIRSMTLRANQRNIKLVGRLPFHEELVARTGKPYPYLEIFLFCDALTAADLLDYNRAFAAYMPCSISLYEDKAGHYWLTTMNLDMLIYGGKALDKELKDKVLSVKEGLLDIMSAGASGSL